ncbi:Clp protease N-terminal domain-containing protein [Phytohabitans sp. ZYX-F-186]|uniref:Clp protease N-terminal domain-containing protein n=1 Tax=Phytohabitans maris TaxID=3071409 RepID=A0ABU0ZQ24_9ACTN|nr:Clp protease N-terminal domain-containing protein [Phytohabitans sp. ZYX-F-186]MDQ7909133.1 Clp protease N-terminal domain-containing protein [Phytohabitans sp. ZYX-F-186]
MFERFTDRARDAVKGAQVEARALHHRYIGTEHLLLALLGESGGLAGTVLRDAGVFPEQVRADILAARRDPLGMADAEALRAIGIDLDAVREKVEETFGEGALEASPTLPLRRRGLFRRVPAPAAPSPGHIPFSPRAKKVLELALREALHLKHKHIGTEHILLGLIREGEGLAAMVLTNAGLRLEDLRRHVLDALARAA